MSCTKKIKKKMKNRPTMFDGRKRLEYIESREGKKYCYGQARFLGRRRRVCYCREFINIYTRVHSWRI